jgi:hypothetical protein
MGFSVHHNVCPGGLVLLPGNSSRLVHLHFLVLLSFTLLLGLLLVFLVAAAALGFQILATSVRCIILDFSLNTAHLCIFAFGTFSLNSVALDFSFDGDFELRFFGAIGCFVVRGSVGFGLVGRKFGGRGRVRVPANAC